MDERIAAEILDGEWKERIAAILKLGFAAVCRTWGAKVKPEDFEPHAERRRSAGTGGTSGTAGRPTDTGMVASPNQAAALAACWLGPPNRKKQ